MGLSNGHGPGGGEFEKINPFQTLELQSWNQTWSSWRLEGSDLELPSGF